MRIKRHRNRQKRKMIVFGLIMMLMMSTGCGDSVYMEKTYEADASEPVEGASVSGQEAAENEPNAATELSETHETKTEEHEVLEETEKNTEKVQEERTLVVYICGAVAVPGVYELPEDARVIQAIEAAGGLLADADTVTVNHARKLEDGEQIRILTKEEAKEMQDCAVVEEIHGQASDGNGSGETDKVNINLADETTLMTLPGIGQAKAAAIVAYRESNGKFTSITDIMKISGIKESVFSKIEDLITV